MVIAQLVENPVGQVLSPIGVVGVILAALTGFVPVVAVLSGLVAITYYCMCMYNFPEVKVWRTARAKRRQKQKVARLERKRTEIIARLRELGALEHAQITVEHVDGETRTVTSTVQKE